MFAEDSTLYLTGENINHVINTLNEEFNDVYKWTIANRLTLNLKKINYLIFNRNRNLNIALHDSIKINDEIINRVKKLCFLVLLYRLI